MSRANRAATSRALIVAVLIAALIPSLTVAAQTPAASASPADRYLETLASPAQHREAAPPDPATARNADREEVAGAGRRVE